MNSKLPAEPILVGRDQEIKQFTQYFDSAMRGKGATIFACGEAGVGKTRLVNEFLNQAKRKGAKILQGYCMSEVDIPYFPFTEAFNTYMSALSDEKAKSSVTKQLGITGWLRGSEITREAKASELFSTPEIERDRTFEAVARVLLQLSNQEPLILFLDDLQWADHLSLAILHYLARKCRNSRLLIIGTYRPEDLVHTKEEKLHPLEEIMFSMSREDLLVKMELKCLRRNDFPDFLRSIFHSSLDDEFVEKLYEETEGNPFFALETLNLLVEEGFLSEKKGRWMLMAPTEKIGIPSKVHDVIIRRIARLEREERKLLDLAAVCGHSFTPDTLSRTLALDIADVLQELMEIEQRHRLIRSTDTTFEFTHQKIREVIYSNLPGELRRVYHLKTANCLEQVLTEKTSDGYIAEIALHYVEGGAPEKAFEYLIKLGEKAVNISANAQAIEHLEKALEATQKNMSLATNENLAKIYKLKGRAWLSHGEMAKASNDFNWLLQNATSIGDESMIAEAHYWLGCALTWLGKIDEAKLHLTRALEIARKTGNKHVEAGSLLHLVESLFVYADTMEEAHMQIEESLRICREITDRVLEAGCLAYLGFYYDWKGEFNRAKETINEALALAEKMDDNYGKMWALLLSGMVHAGEGEYNDAISTLQRCLQLSRDWGIVFFVPRALNVLGWIYHDLENIEFATKYNNEGLRITRTHQESMGLSGVQLACLVNLGMDYLHKNDYGNAKKYFQEANSVIHLHPMAEWRFETRILLGLGEISLAEGDYSQALKFSEDSLAISEKAGAKKYISKSLKLKAETLAKIGNSDEAIELMQKALKAAQEVGNPPLLWQIHYSLGLLLEKSGSSQANYHYAEAITLIEATASKVNDPSLKNSLLNASLTSAIRDAYTETKPTSDT
ncbi:MAG: tetratricopeptide repeat protein [Candidatus Bathyarchaeia archaeon]